MAKPRPTTPYEQFLLLKKKRQTQKEILPNENTNQQHQQQQKQQQQQKSRTPAFNISKSYRYECASEPLGPGSKVLETFEANVIRNKDGSFTFLNQQQQQQQQQKQKQKQQLQQQQKQEDVLTHMMRRPQRDEGEGEVPPHMNIVTKIAQRLMAVERELDATKKELNAVKKALKIVNVDRNRNRNGNGINKKNTEIESDDVLSDHDDDDIDSDDAWSDSNDLKEGFENSGVFSFDSNCDEMDSSEDEHQIWKGDDQAYKCHRRRDGGDNGGDVENDVENDGDGDGDGGNSGDANINSRTSTCTKGIKKREGKGIMAPTRKSRRHQNPTDRYQNTTKSAERLKEGRSVSVNVTIARHSYHMDADAGADSDSNSANRSSSTCSSHHQPLSAIIHSRYNEWDTDESDHPEDFCGQH